MTPGPAPAPFPLVGIGASAGGLEALQEFFSNLPPDTGCAFVVVTHMHREHTSMLPELLARIAPIPVVEAADGQPVEANHVYVAPPGDHLIIEDGILRRSDQMNTVRLPIDHFLRSLATDRRENAICIILSGTGTDGTLGLRAVKGEGGTAIVQRPQSAKFAGMPASAEATGLADFILSPAEMPPQLVPFVRELHSRSLQPAEAAPDFPAQTLQQILSTLRMRTGNDFSSYKPSTIRRRIERRMAVHGIQSPDEFARFIREDKAEANLLFRELLITVTSFFRDPDAFQALANLLAEKLHARRDHEDFRVWVPGCATGEEAYSVAIVLHECMNKLGNALKVQIFASDLDSDAIEIARQGIYAGGIAADVSTSRLKRYFAPHNDSFRINNEIREMAIFAPHNVLSDPPFTRLDVIVCRNLLIYFETVLQKQLLPTFHYALKRSGILFLGPSETVGILEDLFEPIDRKWKIYRRKDTDVVHPWRLETSSFPRAAGALADMHRRPTQPPVKSLNASAQIQQHLLSRYAPTCLVLEENGNIIYIQGRSGLYLEPAEGEPNHNALEMARDGLAAPLAELLRRAAQRHGIATRRGVSVKSNGKYLKVDVTVIPIEHPAPLRGLLLVELHPSGQQKEPKAKSRAPRGKVSVVADLEEELRHSKQSLQSTVEELESANEELKSANEELQSMNEELQSTNEELETSKEEMQSLNEELSTVNAELNSKVEELSHANDDMQNLLNGIDVAAVFLDENLRIKRYTQQARDMIHLVPADIGRPLADLAIHLEYPRLIDDCRRVLKSLDPHEGQVRGSDGAWYIMRILPYRTSDNVIEGVVVTFVSISALKQAQDDAHDALLYYEAIAQSVREPFLVLDDKLMVRTANDAFYLAFDLSDAAVEGRRIYDLDHGEWDIPALRKLLDDIVPGQERVHDFEIAHEFPRVGSRRFLVNARLMVCGAGSQRLTLLAMEEVTERRP